jgi:hypothetical protein
VDGNVEDQADEVDEDNDDTEGGVGGDGDDDEPEENTSAGAGMAAIRHQGSEDDDSDGS